MSTPTDDTRATSTTEGSTPSTAPAPARSRQVRRSDAEVTRARMLQAAVDCILESGYYKASSNAIARKAGVTWGAIQYQFGSRETLMLELIVDRWSRIQNDIHDATVTGETLQERLGSVYDRLEAWYGAPEHVAHVQVLLDLSSDPSTSESTRQAAMAHGKAISQAWQPLFVQAMGEAGTDRELVNYAFLTFRGFQSANVLSSEFTKSDPNKRYRDLVVEGVAAAIAERAAERGLSVG